MATKLVEASEPVDQGIPLDLGPLLSPYRRHKNLSIRVEKLPQLSRLSQGRNNGDCTFSLKPDELQGLLYLPPPGSEWPPTTLAVRIINLDDDYATTLALIDLPLPSGPISEDGKKTTLRVVESSQDTEDDSEHEPAEPAALTAIHVKRNTDVGDAILPAGTDVRQELEAEISQLRKQLETSATESDQTQKQVLEAAEAALARDFVEQIAATKEQLEKGFTDRLSEALREVEEKAEARIAAAEEKARDIAQTDQAGSLKDQVATAKKEQEQEFKDRLAQALATAEQETEARITVLEKQAEADNKAALADAQKNFDTELAQLRQQQEAAAHEINAAGRKEIEEAETEHAREIAKLQASQVRALETQASAMAEQLESEFADRLKQALADAEEKATAQVAALEQQQKETEAEAERALAESKTAFESEISELRINLEAAATDIEKGHKQALETTDKTHADEIAALQKSHASELAAQIAANQEQISATEARLAQESTDSLAETLRLAEEKAAAALAEARQSWDSEAQTSLLAARDTWTSEEAARLASVKKDFEGQLAQLRQQLDADSTEVAEMGRLGLEAANTAHAQEIAELKNAQELVLEEQIAASNKQLEQEVADRVAEALSQGETAAAESIETALAEARQAWEADAEAAMSAARITWRAEEAERLEAAKNDYEGQLTKLRKDQPAASGDIDIDLDEIRQQAIEEAEAKHAAEIAELKAAHAEALESQTAVEEKSEPGDIAQRIAEAVREVEEKTEARIAKSRLVWEADAEAKLAKARETWKTEEADRLAAAKNTWQGRSRKGPTARERAYREQRSWKLRRKHVLALVVAGLIGFPLAHPNYRPLVFERSIQAYSEIKSRIDALLVPKPAAPKTQASSPAATPIPLPSLADLPVSSSGRVIIAVGSANVRSGPSSDAPVVKSLPRGSEASVLGSDKGWQLIRFGEGSDDVGWVYGDLLSAPPTGEPTP